MIVEIAGGSIAGFDHTKPGQPGYTNNHDSFSWKQSEDLVIAVVTDGCSKGKHSEVGSKIANSILVKILFDELNRLMKTYPDFECNDLFWQRIQARVISRLTVLTEFMGESISEIVSNHFLFTCIGVVMTPKKTYIFSLGDGMYVLNGEINELGPFPKNAPPYMMYALTGSSLFDESPELLKIQINEEIATCDVQTLLLGTDGIMDLLNIENECIPGQSNLVGPLNQFWDEDKFFRNPDMIRRRLAMINKETVAGNKITPGLLPDDTTCIVVRQPEPIG